MSSESVKKAIDDGLASRRRGEIHAPRDWSHEEQLRHIMSCPGPGEKQPFDWFGFWFAVLFLAVLVGAVSAMWWVAS